MPYTVSETVKKNMKVLKEVRAASAFFGDPAALPDKNKVIEILNNLQNVLFPGYFGKAKNEYAVGALLTDVHSSLTEQIKCAEELAKTELCAEKIADAFVNELPEVLKLLLLDVEAFYVGDPAAESREEIIFSYPGFYAIFVHRLAHILYKYSVPFIPRIMTEHAHSLTGVDIHAGATIGRSFFIDHATGVVIGETTEIGDRVKIYQGVTIGALSTRGGQSLRGKKRHPTIGNDVTIYSGATILGGETVIGDGATISGNAFIIKSVAPGEKA